MSRGYGVFVLTATDSEWLQNVQALRNLSLHPDLRSRLNIDILVNGKAKSVSTVQIRPDGWAEADGHRYEPGRLTEVTWWIN